MQNFQILRKIAIDGKTVIGQYEPPTVLLQVNVQSEY